MRNFIQLAAVLTVCCSMSFATAQDKVVVIPLNSAKKLNHIVTVSAKGGDFTDPVAAINSITNASEANPYLVLIGPGVYTLTQTMRMKPYVTITGSGRYATTLTGAISSGVADASSAIVSGADNATLSDITVENTGGGECSIALYNNVSSPVIQDVSVIASGGMSNYGMYNNYSSPIITDVQAKGLGAGINCAGVTNINSSPIMTDVIATASGGGSTNYGLVSGSSSPIIRHSTLNGTTAGIQVIGGTTRIIRSSIIGGASIVIGTLTCLYSDNGVSTALNAICQ